MSDDNWYDPKPPTLEECARVVKSLTLCITFLKRERLRSSMAEQQFCKLPVAGSSPAVGSLDAVPEAIAYADGEPAPICGGEAGLSPRDGTGNTPQTHTTPGEGSVPGACTLTAEERQAVEEMLHLIATKHEDYGREAHHLRTLLERLAVTNPRPIETSAEVSSHPVSDRIYVSSKDTTD